MSADETPIILAHGIYRFDILMNTVFDMDNSDDDRLHYFRKIRSALRAAGFKHVYHSRVSWGSTADNRARDLKDELERITENFAKFPKVHIIAHSFGGLDARHMIANYRLQHQVASLSTIGTPHLGSSFADWVVDHFDFAVGLVERAGLDLRGLRDATRDACRKFNDENQAWEMSNGVKYRTYAGVQSFKKTFAPLKLSHAIVQDAEGDNDGLVSKTSAAWRPELLQETIDADHLNEVGWWDVAELIYDKVNPETYEKRIRDFYVEIAESL